MSDEQHRRAASARVVGVHLGADGWGVVTIEHGGNGHQAEPCRRCPWAVDSPVGAFPPEVFRHSARTAYDMATHTFGCHGSDRAAPLTCAGFLLRGAMHNLTVRMRGPNSQQVSDGGRELYENYRAMAIANGVDPDDPALAPCRDNDYGDRHGRHSP